MTLVYTRKLSKHIESYRLFLPHAVAEGWARRGVKMLDLEYIPDRDELVVRPITKVVSK